MYKYIYIFICLCEYVYTYRSRRSGTRAGGSTSGGGELRNHSEMSSTYVRTSGWTERYLTTRSLFESVGIQSNNEDKGGRNLKDLLLSLDDLELLHITR
jgi:hypothetical protein